MTATNTGTSVPPRPSRITRASTSSPTCLPAYILVEFRRDGFETLLHPAVTVNSTEVARIDAALHVGAVERHRDGQRRSARAGHGHRLGGHQHEGRRG